MSRVVQQRGGAQARTGEPEVVVRDTTIAPHRSSTLGPPPRVEELVLTWSISRAGAAACGMVQNGTGQAVKLELRVGSPRRNGRVSIAARVADGEVSTAILMPESAGQWIEDSIAGVWHLDVEGLLKLTIRQSAERTEALYARTELLAKAGLGGGRCEVEGAALRGVLR